MSDPLAYGQSTRRPRPHSSLPHPSLTVYYPYAPPGSYDENSAGYGCKDAAEIARELNAEAGARRYEVRATTARLVPRCATWDEDPLFVVWDTQQGVAYRPRRLPWNGPVNERPYIYVDEAEVGELVDR